MKSLRDLLRLIRLAQSSMAVSHYLRDIERSRSGLAKAIQARQDALADIRIHESPQEDSEPPKYLLKRQGSNVKTIRKAKA